MTIILNTSVLLLCQPTRNEGRMAMLGTTARVRDLIADSVQPCSARGVEGVQGRSLRKADGEDSSCHIDGKEGTCFLGLGIKRAINHITTGKR